MTKKSPAQKIAEAAIKRNGGNRIPNDNRNRENKLKGGPITPIIPPRRATFSFVKATKKSGGGKRKLELTTHFKERHEHELDQPKFTRHPYKYRYRRSSRHGRPCGTSCSQNLWSQTRRRNEEEQGRRNGTAFSVSDGSGNYPGNVA